MMTKAGQRATPAVDGVRIASGVSSPPVTVVNGKYAIQTTESSGDWIANVKHEDIDGVQCKGAQSKIRSAG